MYLVDTNVISELRRGEKANLGVSAFFQRCVKERSPIYLSVITIGELQRGVELIHHRGDTAQAQRLRVWLDEVTTRYQDVILPITQEIALNWGEMRVPHPQNPLDKLIAATAKHHRLTVVTRNEKDFTGLSVEVLNPFS